MEFKQKITEYSLTHYKLITVIMTVLTFLLGAMIPLIKIDTDPENMLSAGPQRLLAKSVKNFPNLMKYNLT